MVLKTHRVLSDVVCLVVLAEVDRIRRTSVELTEVDGILIGAGIHRRKLGALALEGGEHRARHTKTV